MLSLIVRFCTKYMSIGVVLIGIFSIFWPEVMKPFAPKIPPLLGIIMFGMRTDSSLRPSAGNRDRRRPSRLLPRRHGFECHFLHCQSRRRSFCIHDDGEYHPCAICHAIPGVAYCRCLGRYRFHVHDDVHREDGAPAAAHWCRHQLFLPASGEKGEYDHADVLSAGRHHHGRLRGLPLRPHHP